MSSPPVVLPSIATALADSEPSWVTLPSRDEELPGELRIALDDFDAGKRAAAKAAGAWLRTQSVTAHQVVVDPFDEETAAMWRERYGFRPSAEARKPKRLWLPLQPVG